MTTSTYPFTTRLFYAGLWCCALPLYVLYFLYRSLKQPAYRKHLMERFGFYSKPLHAPLWLHASSLGELKAAAPLLAELRLAHPELAILISCQTPAGRQAAQALQLENSLCVYLPFDLFWCTQRFLRMFKPRIALIFETEIWPNLFQSVRQADVPLLIINARITERSTRRYQRFGALFSQALTLPDAIVCQSQADADRYIQAGAKPEAVTVSGNIKWDIEVEHTNQRPALYQRNPVWVAVSTHDAEEQMVLANHQTVLQAWPDALLLWAPRHPERFEPVHQLALKAGMRVQRRSQQAVPDASCQLFIIDSLGELVHFLPGANVVFVGGSMQNIGGHNVLEPAALGLPVLVGPHTQNFTEVVSMLKNAGGLLQVTDERQLTENLVALLQSPARAEQIGQCARACVLTNRGALQKTKALIEQRL